MPHLDRIVFIIACRDERSLGHHTLRAYWQGKYPDLKTYPGFVELIIEERSIECDPEDSNSDAEESKNI